MGKYIPGNPNIMFENARGASIMIMANCVVVWRGFTKTKLLAHPNEVLLALGVKRLAARLQQLLNKRFIR
jgi:hypothetical protein